MCCNWYINVYTKYNQNRFPKLLIAIRLKASNGECKTERTLRYETCKGMANKTL